MISCRLSQALLEVLVKSLWTLIKGHNALRDLCDTYPGVDREVSVSPRPLSRWCILVIKIEPPFGKLYVSIKRSVQFFYVVWTGCKARKTHSVVCLQRPGENQEDCNSLIDIFFFRNNANFRSVLLYWWGFQYTLKRPLWLGCCSFIAYLILLNGVSF